MAEKTCKTCQKPKSTGKFYKTAAGGHFSDCKKCYNFMRSVEFLDYAQGKIKRLDSPEKQKIADRILLRMRVKNILRPKM